MSLLFIIAVLSGISIIFVLLYARKKKELSDAVINWEILRKQIESERDRLEQENAKLRHLEAKKIELYKSKQKLEHAWNVLKENYERYKIKKNQLEKDEQKLRKKWRELQEKQSSLECQTQHLKEIQSEIQTERRELERQRALLVEERRKNEIEKEKLTKEVVAEEFAENLQSASIDAKGCEFHIVSNRNKIHLQVGLDLGTSCTKVVYSQLGKKDFRIVEFSQGLPHYPSYVLPSLATFESSGKLLLGVEAAQYLLDKEWDSGFQRFKMIVAGNANPRFVDKLTREKFEDSRKKHGLDESFSAEILTAVFLAHAICECRKLFQNMAEYQGSELDIAFNICMPIDQFENDAVIKQFERIFAVAERVAEKWDKEGPSFDAIQATHDVWDNPFSPDAQRVFAIPESVASIASYLVSLQKREGLHAMIDFGSGTTDVSICNITMLLGELSTYWYSASNLPFGTVNIERIIAAHLINQNQKQKCTYLDIYDYLHDLVNPKNSERRLLDEIYSRLYGLKKSNEYYDTWGRAYNHFKSESAWENVQIFISGGGASLPFLREIFSEPWWKNLQNRDSRYPVELLPKPDNYDPGNSNAPFHRMAVAYGLAIPKPKLEDYKLPSEAPDHTPPKLPVLDLDHEDFYLK